MSFFIEDAWAQQIPSTGPGIELFLMIGVFFLIMYLLIIRPQNKRSKAHKAMLSTMAKGDEVVTSGGILGKVTEVAESFVGLEVQKNVVIKVQKQSIGSVMPKGTIKNA